MANVTVPTSPRGVWPRETASIDETVYAQVEADVLRRKDGDLREQMDERDRLDLVEKSTHAAPKITVGLEDTEATVDDDDVAFTVEFSGDPTPEVKWYQTTTNGYRTELVDNAGTIDIATDADSSTLTLDDIALSQDGLVIEAVVRNYKGTVRSSCELTVVEAP